MEELTLPTCSICLESFGINEPNKAYLLLCGHSYHLHCIKKITETSNEIICPLCRSPTPGTASSLKLNFSLLDLLEVFQNDIQELDKTTPCDECSSIASLFCVSCGVPYCGEHDKIAHTVKVMASHNRVPVSKKNLHVVKKCKEHNKHLKIFCITCQSPICTLCRDYGLHKTHETDIVTSIIEQAQSELRNCLQIMEISVEGLDKTLVKLTESVERVRGSVNEVDNRIDQQVDELIICLHSRASFLKEEMKKIAKEEESLLHQQREKVASASALGHALCDEIRHVLHKDEGLLIIQSKKQITEKIQSAQSVFSLDTQDSTNLEIPYSLECERVVVEIQQFGIVGPSNRKRKEDKKNREERKRIEHERKKIEHEKRIEHERKKIEHERKKREDEVKMEERNRRFEGRSYKISHFQ